MMYLKPEFDNGPKYEDLFGYWFVPQELNQFDVYFNGEAAGSLVSELAGPHVDVYGTDGKPMEDEEAVKVITAAFQMFKRRPEYGICTVIDSEDRNPENTYNLYTKALVGISLIRAFKKNHNNPDKYADRAFRAVEWLRSTDFFTAPASSFYHDSFCGGLVYHSLQVVKNIVELRRVPKFVSVSYESAWLVALLHDWCKIGLYTTYLKNVKNEETGVWEKVPTYKYRDEGSPYPFGHGEASMYLGLKFFSLTMEECLAIRHHMGRWHASQDQLNDLQHSNILYPTVLLLQFADQLAVVHY